MEKERYVSPAMEIVEFESDDVIAGSPPGGIWYQVRYGWVCRWDTVLNAYVVPVRPALPGIDYSGRSMRSGRKMP